MEVLSDNSGDTELSTSPSAASIHPDADEGTKAAIARHNLASHAKMLAKIPADEPVFIIRGRDVLAPATIEHWAQGMTAFGGREELVNEAREFAALCRELPFRKLAD